MKDKPLTNAVYWLYHSGKFITGVVASVGIDDESVRVKALDSHQRVPLQPVGFNPREWSKVICGSEVRRN